MNSLACPLCCQQDFSSIIALREHLLYYIYRPISCPVCCFSVGGIHGLTRHLESHHIDNKNTTDANIYGKEEEKKDNKELGLPNYELKNKINSNRHGSNNILRECRLLNNSPNLNIGLDVRPNPKENMFCEQYKASTDTTVTNDTTGFFNQENKLNQSKTQDLPNIIYKDQFGILLNDTAEIIKGNNLKKDNEFCSTNESSLAEAEITFVNTSSSSLGNSSDETELYESFKDKNKIKLECADTNSNKTLEGFQALSEAVRAFVCITCGAKIVGKDLYFKHIQGKCSSESFSDSTTFLKKSNCDINIIDKRTNYVSASLSSSSYEKIPNTDSQNFPIVVNDFDLENGESCEIRPAKTFQDIGLVEVSNFHTNVIEKEKLEIIKDESRPYIHKKFDHDQERKIPTSQVPSSDVQCYIQNFQSLLVNKLNQTLDNNNTKLSSSYFEIETERHLTYPTSVCEVKSPLVTSCPEKNEFQLKNAIKKKLNNKVLRCKFCSKMFSKPYLLLRHQQELHSSTTYFCNLCGHHFKSKRTLENHKGTHQKKAFHCLKCKYSCFTASGLRTHVFEIHSKKIKCNFVCSICSESFKKKYGLWRHMKRKHENNRSLCNYCDQEFLCKEDLNMHTVIHLNGKVLTCDICKKQFASISSLKRHNLTHGDKRFFYKCKICTKAFTRKDSLQNHMKLHK